MSSRCPSSCEQRSSLASSSPLQLTTPNSSFGERRLVEWKFLERTDVDHRAHRAKPTTKVGLGSLALRGVLVARDGTNLHDHAACRHSGAGAPGHGVGERRHGDRGPGAPGASPLKRAGRDFKPHESVRVRVVSGTRTSTPAGRASRGGRFTVTFQGFAFPSCAADGYGGLYALLETLPDGAMKVA